MIEVIKEVITSVIENGKELKENIDNQKEAVPKIEDSAEVYEDSPQIFNPFKTIELDGLAPQDTEQARLISGLINNSPEFNLRAWENLSVEQKVDALNRTEQKIAEITKRNPCIIAAEPMEEGLRGYQTENKIVINSNLLSDNSQDGMKQCLRTFLHEGRHAYQSYNMEVKIVEQNAELVEAWQLNNDMGYENGDSSIFDFKKMGIKRYLTQPVELDARAFAESILDKTNL